MLISVGPCAGCRCLHQRKRSICRIPCEDFDFTAVYIIFSNLYHAKNISCHQMLQKHCFIFVLFHLLLSLTSYVCFSSTRKANTHLKKNRKMYSNHIFKPKLHNFESLSSIKNRGWNNSRARAENAALLCGVVFFLPLYFVRKCLWSIYADGIVRLHPRYSRVRLYSP